MKMYWLESLDHSEDWFVLAQDARSALRFFCLETGYDLIDDEVKASLVCDVPVALKLSKTQYALEDVLEACGGIVRSMTNPELLRHYSVEALECLGSECRVVTLNGKTYIEGNIANTVVDSLVGLEEYN